MAASSSTPRAADEQMDVSKFTQEALRTVLSALGKSNDLLSGAKDFDFYNSFKGFRKFMSVEGVNITKQMSCILSNQGIKCRLDGLDSDELFDALVEANDLILERVGTAIDEVSGVNKIQEPILVSAAATRAEIKTSWNRKKTVQGAQTYRLLTAQNILRPQLKFMDKIDNSLNPFEPIIKEKPNSIKPLSIILEQTEYGEMYTHPYQCELDHFNPKESQLQLADTQDILPLDKVEYIFVNTVDQVNSLVADLKLQTEIAVDLEHHSYRSFQGITCLMQISTRKKDYLIDTLELRNNLQILNEVFTDPNIVKVFHGADKDVEWLQRDLGLYVVNMFDTGQASRILSFAHFSLAFLLKHYCDVVADKQYQLADWRIRPLPDEMVRYAREDTHYLLHIYDKMKNELIAKGNQTNNLLISVFQRTKVVCEKRYVKPSSSVEGYLDLCKKYGKIFNTRQTCALRDLYQWRNNVARLEDESLGYVLPNHMLMQIAEVLPREMQGVLACCNPIPPLVRHYLNELHQIILRAREQSLVTPVVQQLQMQVDESRREVDLDNVLLCPHDYSHLKESGAYDTGPTLLDLWNKHGDDLENEIRTLNTGVPIKVKAQMSAIVNDNKKPNKVIKTIVNDVISSMSSYLSPFARYKLACPDYGLLSKGNFGTSKLDESTASTDEVHVKNVEDHFMKLVESEEATSSSQLNAAEHEESMKKVDGGKDEDSLMPSLENNDLTPIRKSIKKVKKRKPKNKKERVEGASPPKKKKTVINEDDFKPFDYSQTQQHIKNSKVKSKKRQIHDPTLSSESYQTGKASKTRLKGKGRSFSFASKGSKRGIKRQKLDK